MTLAIMDESGAVLLAWWTSDHQFLVDSRDRLELPWERPGADAPSASTIRLGVLAARLAQAQAVFAVSESFAALYRRAGIANVTALVNGLAELPPLEPAAKTEAKFRTVAPCRKPCCRG